MKRIKRIVLWAVIMAFAISLASRSWAVGQAPKIKRVVITFDDGPRTDVTSLILKILAGNGVVAVFFILGEGAITNPDLV